MKVITGIIGMLLLFVACKKNSGTIENISSHNANKSHNMGANCMECHKSGGIGKGEFLIAGTVYLNDLSTPYPNTSVYLRTEPNGGGAILYTLQVDANGNFYSTDPIDFSEGLYPNVAGETTTKHMGQPITNGACNSCHHNTARIWTE
jgi:hypothetical protein